MFLTTYFSCWKSPQGHVLTCHKSLCCRCCQSSGWLVWSGRLGIAWLDILIGDAWLVGRPFATLSPAWSGFDVRHSFPRPSPSSSLLCCASSGLDSYNVTRIALLLGESLKMSVSECWFWLFLAFCHSHRFLSVSVGYEFFCFFFWKLFCFEQKELFLSMLN